MCSKRVARTHPHIFSWRTRATIPVPLAKRFKTSKGKTWSRGTINYCHLPYRSLPIQCLLPSKPENALKQMQQKVKRSLKYYHPDHIPILGGEMRNGCRKLFQHMFTSVKNHISVCRSDSIEKSCSCSCCISYKKYRQDSYKTFRASIHSPLPRTT